MTGYALFSLKETIGRLSSRSEGMKPGDSSASGLEKKSEGKGWSRLWKQQR